MKRLTLLVVLLGVMGLAAGFALEVKPAFALTGSATLTWGVDLNDFSTGFTNAGTADFTVTLVALNSTDTHAGKGGLYGSITISNLTLLWIDGALNTGDSVAGASEAAVSAKLVAGPIEVGINGAPGAASDQAAPVEADDDTDDATAFDAIVDDETADLAPAYAGNGTYVKYTADMFSVELDLKSADAHVANNANAYAFGAVLSFTAVKDVLTLGAGAFYGVLYAANPFHAYVTASLTAAPITLGVQVDTQVTPSFAIEPAVNVKLAINKEATAYLQAWAYVNYATALHLDSKVTFMVPTATLMGPVNFDVTANILDIGAAAIEYSVEANAGYKMPLSGDMYLKPTLNVKYGDASEDVAYLGVTVGAEIGLAAAPAVTLTPSWASGNLLQTAGLGAVTFALVVTY